jgi:ABC-type transport system substrate-binding protein
MAPFDNDKVRQALAIGIDKKSIIDKFYPPGTVTADYFTPCEVLGGCEGDPWPKYDFNAAKQMLTDAGVKPGTKLVLSYRNNDRPYVPAQAKIAEEFQAQLKKLGFDVTLDQQESGPFLSAANEGKLLMAQLGWIGDFPDQLDWVGYHFNNPAEKQFGNIPNDLKDAISKANTTMDPAQRKQAFVTVNNLIAKYVPMVPVAHSTSAVAFKAAVQGAHSSPMSNELFAVMQIPGQEQLVFSQNGEPPGLYCADETDGEAFRVCIQVFDGLYSYKVGSEEVQPSLAESCTPNATGDEWTCKLRSGVKFSDGTPLTANDVVETFAVQWDLNDPLHTGNTGDFAYWGALFGANIPKK